MVAQINAIHFEASERLEQFIQKKVDRLYRRFDWILAVEVNLRVVKPESAHNKEAGILLQVPNSPDLFASKTADTFEEAIDESLDALERQLEKLKDKNANA
ncbi:MAG: ribosome-associated translation inhibitor RaiA [Muribaculaceae bacterium]|nr:ribosome-associated translation inhibitor RaiA [Muribaculaceae bacterium]